jgi:hypothetical protein
MLLYAVTIFISAFLLFQVQPLIAKMILPWFGGGAMVWTSCMLFFQMLLLGGYAYSHKLVSLAPLRQARTHLILLGFSVLTLPIIPRAALKPAGGENPLLGILLVLFTSVGLPYLALSTTGPLLQAWFARRHPGRTPYRLFALSNFASLLALISYPVAFEPAVPLRTQGWLWSGLYLLFAAVCGWTAWQSRRVDVAAAAPAPDVPAVPVLGLAEPGAEPELAGAEQSSPLAPAAIAPAAEEEAREATAADRFAWFALPACASVLLLAVTTHLTQNVAAIPFLWVAPLALYLLSFMLTFDSSAWYNHWFFAVLGPATLALMAYPFWKELTEVRIRLYLPAYCAGLFIACMYCHGEVVRRKPHPKFLTGFYLMISLGGAAGGLLVSVAAPLLLPFHYELSGGLALTALAAMIVVYRESLIKGMVWAGVAVFLIVSVYRDTQQSQADHLVVARNFYGALRVRETGADIDGSRLRTLVNGTINHGAQYVSDEKSRLATTYYGEKSGVGVSLLQMRDHPMKFGVVGLGTGTLTTYARRVDHVKVYEINQLVVDVARTWFTYLKNCLGKCEIVMGDARLSLEREQPNEYDVLAIDAFSSDAIPVHLLTKEAVELFFKHVKPKGIVAVHVSNKYLNLYPVVERIGRELGKATILVESRENGAFEQFSADWVLLANSPDVFDSPAFRAAASTPAPEPNAPFWTDDYSNLFQILR